MMMMMAIPEQTEMTTVGVQSTLKETKQIRKNPKKNSAIN